LHTIKAAAVLDTLAPISAPRFFGFARISA
jgi:hypothetical protein